MIHPTADVQTSSIGPGTTIWQFVVILPGARIGNHCTISCNVFIENDVLIGNYVTIKSGVQLWDGISIENNVFIGPNVTFTNDLTPRSKQYPETFIKSLVCQGASIGANSTIKAGIIIGKHALIGLGSVVTCNIPPYTVWYGNPARHQGYITEDGELISLELISKKDGSEFVYSDFELSRR